MILDEVKDHVIAHIVENNTTREMWQTRTTLLLKFLSLPDRNPPCTLLIYSYLLVSLLHKLFTM